MKLLGATENKYLELALGRMGGWKEGVRKPSDKSVLIQSPATNHEII